jgi:hypothetical protein
LPTNGKVTKVKLSELIPDIQNANLHSERGQYMVNRSLEKLGAGRSILLDKNNRIIAGNLTTEQAEDIGLENVVIVDADGTELVAVRRLDMDLDDPASGAREMAYADNRAAVVSIDFDPEVISKDLELGLDLSDWWTDNEIESLTWKQNNYSRKIDIPIYEPSNDRPPIDSLYDDTKTKSLIESIQNESSLTDEERRFLIIAAQRHTVLRFDRIANYYAHSSKPIQRLMEESLLVIIDIGAVIEAGYMKLTDEISELVIADYGD